MKILSSTFLLVISSGLSFMSTSGSEDVITAENLLGHWEGSTRPIVVWCEKEEISVSLVFGDGGEITGKIGDAILNGAEIRKKRNWFSSRADHTTKYIVEGVLEGPIVEEEGISRNRVFIHIGIAEDHIFGSLATDGPKIGGRDKMAFATTSLKLTKS